MSLEGFNSGIRFIATGYFITLDMGKLVLLRQSILHPAQGSFRYHLASQPVGVSFPLSIHVHLFCGKKSSFETRVAFLPISSVTGHSYHCICTPLRL